MKKIYITLLSIIAVTTLLAQSPQAFKYQAIARDEAGNSLSMWDISLRVSLIQQGADGVAVYVETHKVQTNIYGLISLIIGEGDVLEGEFGSVKWGENRHYIKMEMDIDAGENYKEVGTSQLYAVPYALYAEQAGSVMESSRDSGSGSSSSSSSGSSGNRDLGANSKFPADTNSFLNVNVGNVGVGTIDPQEKLDVIGKIMSTLGYNTNGNDGLSDSMNVVTDIDFDNSLLQYRTLVFTGGIITWKSGKSGWVDTVDVHLDFACGDSLLDVRDGQKYATVLIGTQCWLKENINYETGNSWCYGADPANCATYGRLYDWESVLGACPSGWHLSTDDEWKILEGTVDSSYPVGDSEWDGTGWRGFDVSFHLKSATLWAGTGNGDDSYGFTALPGGQRSTSGNFFNMDAYAFFWTSTESGSNAWLRMLHSGHNEVSRINDNKAYGFSARCLRD